MLNIPYYRRSFLFSLLVFVGMFNTLCWANHGDFSKFLTFECSDYQIFRLSNTPVYKLSTLLIFELTHFSDTWVFNLPGSQIFNILIRERMIYIPAVRTQYRWLHAVEGSTENLFSTEIDIYYTFNDTALILVNFKKVKRARIPHKPIRRNNIEDLMLCRLVFGTGVSDETYYNKDDSTSNKIYNQWNQQWRESFQKDYRSNWLLFL